MKRAYPRVLTGATMLVCGLLIVILIVGIEAANQPRAVQIGMAKTFLEEKPMSHIEIATNDFKEVMKKSSGLDGVINPNHTAFEVAEKLDKKQLDFGILHAHEFAWVQKKHPDLQLLLIANHKRLVDRAFLIVHQNSAAKSIADLRGKKFDLPKGASQSCRLFLDKLCNAYAQKTPAAFFESIKKSATQADALDEVARGKVDATVVDIFALDFYKEVKGPVFAKNLQVLQESADFPPAVIVFKKGGIDEATRTQFSNGLLKAHTIALGRDLMKAWNMDAFEAIPKDFDKRLAEVLKAYPAPESK